VAPDQHLHYSRVELERTAISIMATATTGLTLPRARCPSDGAAASVAQSAPRPYRPDRDKPIATALLFALPKKKIIGYTAPHH